MSDKVTSTITSRAKHLGHTQDFIASINDALDTFKDEVTSLAPDIHMNAYRTYIEAYRDALVPVWNLARLADIDIILQTVTDRELKDLTAMAKKLKTSLSRTSVTTEKSDVPDLETLSHALTSKFPQQSLSTETSAKIGEVFTQLHIASKAYSKAAEGLAELSTLVTPEQFTLLLMATTPPTIQLNVPGHQMSTLILPQPQTSTMSSRIEIINSTKRTILPNPESKALRPCEKNSFTRVLAAAIYCRLEKHYFDETRTRIDIANSFLISNSQLSKAVTGIDYKSGPHHYKKKCTSTSTTAPTSKSPRVEPSTSTTAPTSKSSRVTPTTFTAVPEQEEDILSSSSSSDLPPAF